MDVHLPPAMSTVMVASSAYLCGSIPFGFLAAMARGVDIREVGSGNIGATNVKRACGPLVGRLVLLLDISKGFIPTVVLAPRLAKIFSSARLTDPELAAAAAVAGLFAIVGHNWPIWLGFKGGKGVAVTIGAFAALMQWWVFIPLFVWAAVAKGTRYVSVASMALGASVAVTAAVLVSAEKADGSVAAVGLAAAALILLRHRANIARLRAGTEPRRGDTVSTVPAPEAAEAAEGAEGGEAAEAAGGAGVEGEAE